MKFREYYAPPFVEDLNAFRTWAGASRISHREDLEGVFAIQPHLIKEHAKEVASWGTERVALFSAALFFTVLIDQICYTYFQHGYREFQHLTRYPKLRGLCPGGCQNRHPTLVFSWLAEALGESRFEFEHGYRNIVGDAIPVMKDEVFDFFCRHVSSIEPAAFWGQCESYVLRYEGE